VANEATWGLAQSRTDDVVKLGLALKVIRDRRSVSGNGQLPTWSVGFPSRPGEKSGRGETVCIIGMDLSDR
jgi:hypothetical protein